MKLYTQHRNSAGERVRIALNLKGLAYDYVAVSSLPPGAYQRINPQGLIPALEVEGQVIAQSGAILAYLEETWPKPALLPPDPILRAQARAFCQHIAAEMHAVAVERVRRFLVSDFGADEAGALKWVRHWTDEGLRALETALADRRVDSPFCFSAEPGWADLHLVPALTNARRFGCDLAPYPRLLAVEARCVDLDAFRNARPEHQPDHPAT